MGEQIVTVARDGALLRVTVNRPEQLNAMNAEILARLRETFEASSLDQSIRVILIRGSGEKAFIVGADVHEMVHFGPVEAEALSERTRRVYKTIEACPQPVLAGIDGLCIGGGLELALACDLRIASERSRFGLPEVSLGILPGGGGTGRLARLVGVAAAKRLALTGELIDAPSALRMQLVDTIYPAEDLPAAIADQVARLMEKSPAALRRIKALFNQIIWNGAGAIQELEKLSFAQCFATADQKEGMAAFVAKRKPYFRGD